MLNDHLTCLKQKEVSLLSYRIHFLVYERTNEVRQPNCLFCLYPVKFGSNSSAGSGGTGYSDAKMPGARSAGPGDMSSAER